MVPIAIINKGNEGQPHARLPITDQQKQAIANAFEEGHYVMGITILDALCSSAGYVPDHTLIRQLLYLSLYSHEPAKDNVDGNDLQRATFPTPAATEAANTLLDYLADRISPSHLLAALPCYPSIGESPCASPPRMSDDTSISKVVKKAERLAHCRSCWDILKQDFIPPLRVERRTLPGSPTKHNVLESRSNSVTAPQLVGPDSWFSLRWLLHLFERDERETERITDVRYSPLLLSQIPNRRSEQRRKWDATVPLDIAFFSLEQTEHEGDARRLLTLLSNLASSSDFDGPMFTNSLATRFSPDYEYTDTALRLLPEITRFAVCRALLARPVDQPRGRTRRQPVARRKKANSVTDETAPSSVPATPVIKLNPALLCSPSEVVDLLKSSWGDEADALVVKFHLLHSYLDLRQSVPVGESDVDWENMVHTGTMDQIVEATFASREDSKDHLLAKLATCS